MRMTVVVGVLVSVALMAAPLAQAAHSVGPVQRYWDNGNNGFPNSVQTFYAYGSHWPDLAITRLTEAGNEWSNDTQGNPKVVKWTSAVTTTNRRIYLADSGHPNQPCPVSSNDYGTACIDSTYYPAGAFPGAPAHRRIITAAITINARDLHLMDWVRVSTRHELPGLQGRCDSRTGAWDGVIRSFRGGSAAMSVSHERGLGYVLLNVHRRGHVQRHLLQADRRAR